MRARDLLLHPEPADRRRVLRPRVGLLLGAAVLSAALAAGCAVGPAVRPAPPRGADRLLDVRHVYVAEHHADPASIRVQLDVLRDLGSRGVPVTVGIEWLPREAQGALDRWLRGEATDEDFLAEARWKDVWGHDFACYAPVLRLARERSLPVVALNAADDLPGKVARLGPDGLDPEDRARLPPLDSGNDAHRAFFEEAMGEAAEAHAHGHLSLDRLYLAQLVRDETMAAEVARFLEDPASQGRTFVALAGGGHVLLGLGVPERVRARTGLPYVVVVPWRPGIERAVRRALPPDHLTWPAPLDHGGKCP